MRHLWTPLVNDCRGWGYDDQSIDCRPKLHFLFNKLLAIWNCWKKTILEQSTVNIVNLIHFPQKKETTQKKTFETTTYPLDLTNVADCRLFHPHLKSGEIPTWMATSWWLNQPLWKSQIGSISAGGSWWFSKMFQTTTLVIWFKVYSSWKVSTWHRCLDIGSLSDPITSTYRTWYRQAIYFDLKKAACIFFQSHQTVILIFNNPRPKVQHEHQQQGHGAQQKYTRYKIKKKMKAIRGPAFQVAGFGEGVFVCLYHLKK